MGSLNRCRLWIVTAAAGFSLAGTERAGWVAPEPLAIEVEESAHPVLIRNDTNPLLRINLPLASGEGRLHSLTFALEGTDNLRDLEYVEVFSTGPTAAFNADHRYGEMQGPDWRVTFRGDAPLAAGNNYFWLSCRVRYDAKLNHSVAAQYGGLESTHGTEVRLTKSGLRHRIGIALRKHNDDGVHTHRIPTLATSKRGTLLSAYDLRRRMARDLQEDIDIGLSRSTDGGKTWESPRVIMDMGTYGGLPQEQNGCSDPGIIVDRKTGEIFCFCVWMWGKPGKHQWNGDGSEPGYEIGKSAQMLMVRSRDDGKTWSKPENLTRVLKKPEWWLLAPAPQQGIQLTDGTLVMPVQGRDATGVPFATIMHSKDHGKSWTVGGPAFSEGNECQAAQLGDGSIMLNMRDDHRNGFRAVSVTRDLGRTWAFHPTHENTLIEPNCNASLYRFDYKEGGEKRHVLLFSNPQSKKTRDHITLQVSFDDGMTWPARYRRLLDEGRGAGYSSLSRIDEKHVGIVYESSRAQLVFERFSLDELIHP